MLFFEKLGILRSKVFVICFLTSRGLKKEENLIVACFLSQWLDYCFCQNIIILGCVFTQAFLSEYVSEL